MAGYTFFFTRSDRAVPDFDFAEYPGDEEAIAAARRLLGQRSTAQAVEIVRGDTLVGRFEQTRPS